MRGLTMLAPWSVCSDSAPWLRATACSLALAAVFAACGDDPTPTPTATFLLSQAPPSTVEDYMLFVQEFSDGAAEIDKFIGAFSEAIRLDPNDSNAYVQRGTAYVGKYTATLAGEGEYEKAIQDLNDAIRLDPYNVDAYIARGNTYDLGTDYSIDGLGEEIDKAIRDYDTALQHIDKAVSLDPNDVDAYIDRANVYRFKREYDKAIQDFNAAIGLDPSNPKTYFTRGLAYSEKGDHDKAIEDFDKVILLDPNYVHA